MRITITLVVDVDQEGWGEEYGVGAADVSEGDVALHVLDRVLESPLSDAGVLSRVRLA